MILSVSLRFGIVFGIWIFITRGLLGIEKERADLISFLAGYITLIPVIVHEILQSSDRSKGEDTHGE